MKASRPVPAAAALPGTWPGAVSGMRVFCGTCGRAAWSCGLRSWAARRRRGARLGRAAGCGRCGHHQWGAGSGRGVPRPDVRGVRRPGPAAPRAATGTTRPSPGRRREPLDPGQPLVERRPRQVGGVGGGGLVAAARPGRRRGRGPGPCRARRRRRAAGRVRAPRTSEGGRRRAAGAAGRAAGRRAAGGSAGGAAVAAARPRRRPARPPAGVRRASRSAPTEEPAAMTNGGTGRRSAAGEPVQRGPLVGRAGRARPGRRPRRRPARRSARSGRAAAPRRPPARSKSRSRACASSAAEARPPRCRSITPTSRRPSSGTPSARARSATSETVIAWVRTPDSRVRWVCRSRDSRSRSSRRPSARVAAARSSSMVCRGGAAAGPGPSSTSRPQSLPRAPTAVTSQPVRASSPVRPAGASARERRSQPSSRAPGRRPAGSKASTWWARFSSTTGRRPCAPPRGPPRRAPRPPRPAR